VIDVAAHPFRERRLGLSTRLGLPALVWSTIGALLALEAWAASTFYALRVTSDTPTYLPIIADMGEKPFQPVSPFLDTPGVASSHGTPYTQLLGLVWNSVFAEHTASGAPIADPKRLSLFLAGAGAIVTLVLLHAVFVWARSQAGTRAAWLTIPVLLVLFGPAHVIWAGDLTLHGFLYGAYFPQNLALALMLYALASLEGEPGLGRTFSATAFVAATFVVHPFTGALLAALVAGRGSILAIRRRRDWRVGSFALAIGFAIAQLWPAYSLNHSLRDNGLKGWIFVAVCALAPAGVRALERPERFLQMAEHIGWRLSERTRLESGLLIGLALAGMAGVIGLALWESNLIQAGNADPLVQTNRLAIYWVEDRWRWPLMLAAGVVGLLGLVWLAWWRRFVPALWFGGCFVLALAGTGGFEVPVWWRFLLFCQVPLALGVALVLARASGPVLRATVVVTLAGTLVVKLVTLFGLPAENTYFGTPLQTAYSLGAAVPRAPGLVATDPTTAYFVPGATGHRVLSVTKVHVNSQRELAASEAGYALLHEFYAGSGWWQAAQTMWKRGVRYVLVAKQTSLAPPTLREFSTGPTPLVRTAADRQEMSGYYYRNGRVGKLVYDSEEFVVYRLERKRLWPIQRR
jgi:hypothetical protein